MLQREPEYLLLRNPESRAARRQAQLKGDISMKRGAISFWIAAICFGIVAEALCCAAAFLLLRFSGAILLRISGSGALEEAALLLGSLRHASLRFSPFLPFLLCAAGAAAVLYLPAEMPHGPALRILTGAAAWLLALAATVWLSEADGMPFSGILNALYLLGTAP